MGYPGLKIRGNGKSADMLKTLKVNAFGDFPRISNFLTAQSYLARRTKEGREQRTSVGLACQNKP